MKSYEKIIFYYIPIKPDIIVLIILSFIGLNMIVDTFRKEECEKIIDKKSNGHPLLFYGNITMINESLSSLLVDHSSHTV